MTKLLPSKMPHKVQPTIHCTINLLLLNFDFNGAVTTFSLAVEINNNNNGELTENTKDRKNIK